MKKLLIVIFILFLSISTFCQDNNLIKSNIETIDSIAKANKIVFAEVVTNSITSNDGQVWTKKGEFKFVGNFLMLHGKYYNMDKLLYFYIKDDYIGFVLQKI